MNLKRIFFVFASVLFCASIFALPEYKYVDSKDGLKIRDRAGLNGQRIGGLVYDQKIEVVEIGAEALIDGIKSNWVKIRVPSLQAQGSYDSFGWVFAGYLRDEPPEMKECYIGSVNGFGNGKGIFDVENPDRREFIFDLPEGFDKIERHDFEGDCSNYVSATEFGKFIYSKNEKNYFEYFAELPPFTMLKIIDDTDSTYYKIEFMDGEFYVKKSCVVRNAVPSFTLRKTPLYETATSSKTVMILDPRIFILETKETVGNKTKIILDKNGICKTYYADKDNLWSNQKDVSALQTLRSVNDFINEDPEKIDSIRLTKYLDVCADYQETNLFQMDYLILAKLWEYARNFGMHSVCEYNANKLYTDAEIMERYFAYDAGYSYDVTGFNCIGNYIKISTEKNYETVSTYRRFSSSPDSYHNYLIYRYEEKIGRIMSCIRDFIPSNIYGYGTLSEVYNIYKAYNSSNINVMKAYASKLDRDTREKFLGTDDSDDIEGNYSGRWEYFLGRGNDYTEIKSPGKTAAVLPVPGTMGKPLGYLSYGTKVVPLKHTAIYLRSEGGGGGWWEPGYIYVEAEGLKGWVWSGCLEEKTTDETEEKLDFYRERWRSYSYMEEGGGTVVAYAMTGDKVKLYSDLENLNYYSDPKNLSLVVCTVENLTEFEILKKKCVVYANFHENVGSGYDYYVRTPDGKEGWLMEYDTLDFNPYYNSARFK